MRHLRLLNFGVKPLTVYTCKLTRRSGGDPARLSGGAPLPVSRSALCAVRGGEGEDNVVFYESGKLVVQGKGTQEFVEFVLEPEILKEARLGYEAVLNPELLLPRIGVDESGKGDFFGPLCVAGVYVNESVVKAWKDAGIRDSKNISSDKKIRDLAELIRKTPGSVTAVVADWQRSLQPAARQNGQRQRAAGLGPCARDRKPARATAPDEPAAGEGHQRPVCHEQADLWRRR